MSPEKNRARGPVEKRENPRPIVDESDKPFKTLQAKEAEWGGNAIERMSRRYGNYDIATPGVV